jgi:small subunit ribosomal protein S18
MPRINNPKPPKRAPKIDIRRGAKKKPCSFCQHGVDRVDYKDLAQLRKYISDRGKIRGRKVSGNCQQHQRDVSDAIKDGARTRAVALHAAHRDRASWRTWPRRGT